MGCVAGLFFGLDAEDDVRVVFGVRQFAGVCFLLMIFGIKFFLFGIERRPFLFERID